MPAGAVRADDGLERGGHGGLLFTLLASDATYPVVAEALALPESTTIVPANDSVALVVQGRRRELSRSPVARKNHLHASVAATMR